MNLEPDDLMSAQVDSFILQRDVATFQFKHGTIYLLKPIKGRCIGAIFVGDGVVDVTPPTKIEQEQLRRFYKSPTLNKSFSSLFMLFADSSLAELKKQLKFAPGAVKRQAKDVAYFAIKYLSEKDDEYFYSPVIKFVLEGHQNNYWYAHFSMKNNTPMCFEINPYNEEEVSIKRRISNTRIYLRFETVCAFYSQKDYTSGKNMSDKNVEFLKIDQYTIDSRIANNLELDFSATANLDFTVLKSGHRSILFNLFSDMEVVFS